MFRVIRIFFSPTGGSQKIIAAVSDAFAGDEVEITDLDLTPPRAPGAHVFVEADLVLIGAPVYFGRLSQTARERLRTVRGRGIPAFLLVSYGNRAYDDALMELKELAQSNGFIPFAAAAFVAEHSFSTEQFPIAWKRPDAEDMNAARELGQRLRHLLEKGPQKPELRLPGKIPLEAYPEPLRLVPISDSEGCDQCGVCIRACPTAAIRFGRPPITDADKCIQCSACVKVCPDGNRRWQEPLIDDTRAKLMTLARERQLPQFFGVKP